MKQTVEEIVSVWIEEEANPMSKNSNAKEVQEKLNVLSRINSEALVKPVKSLMPDPITHVSSNSLNNKFSGIIGQRLSSPHKKRDLRVFLFLGKKWSRTFWNRSHCKYYRKK